MNVPFWLYTLESQVVTGYRGVFRDLHGFEVDGYLGWRPVETESGTPNSDCLSRPVRRTGKTPGTVRVIEDFNLRKTPVSLFRL